MNKKIEVRLPQVMGPVERWQGQCRPTDTYPELQSGDLTGKQNTILEWIRDFYGSYMFDRYLVENRGKEPVVVLNCEYPKFEGYETVAFNLAVLEEFLQEDGEEKVRSYFRIPEPAHWETGEALNLEKKGKEGNDDPNKQSNE